MIVVCHDGFWGHFLRVIERFMYAHTVPLEDLIYSLALVNLTRNALLASFGALHR